MTLEQPVPEAPSPLLVTPSWAPPQPPFQPMQKRKGGGKRVLIGFVAAIAVAALVLVGLISALTPHSTSTGNLQPTSAQDPTTDVAVANGTLAPAAPQPAPAAPTTGPLVAHTDPRYPGMRYYTGNLSSLGPPPASAHQATVSPVAVQQIAPVQRAAAPQRAYAPPMQQAAAPVAAPPVTHSGSDPHMLSRMVENAFQQDRQERVLSRMVENAFQQDRQERAARQAQGQNRTNQIQQQAGTVSLAEVGPEDRNAEIVCQGWGYDLNAYRSLKQQVISVGIPFSDAPRYISFLSDSAIKSNSSFPTVASVADALVADDGVTRGVRETRMLADFDKSGGLFEAALRAAQNHYISSDELIELDQATISFSDPNYALSCSRLSTILLSLARGRS